MTAVHPQIQARRTRVAPPRPQGAVSANRSVNRKTKPAAQTPTNGVNSSEGTHRRPSKACGARESVAVASRFTGLMLPRSDERGVPADRSIRSRMNTARTADRAGLAPFLAPTISQIRPVVKRKGHAAPPMRPKWIPDCGRSPRKGRYIRPVFTVLLKQMQDLQVQK